MKLDEHGNTGEGAREASEKTPRTTIETSFDVRDVLRRIEEIYEKQRDLIANVSHDFKTPLTIIRAGVENLQQLGSDDPSVRNSVRRIARGVDRLDRLVHDLLLLTRLANDLDDLDYKQTRFDTLVGDAISSLAAAARQKKINWQIELEHMQLYCNVESMGRAVYCLLDNAVRFSPNEGTVKITARREDSSAVLVVADNGPGIPPEEISKVFDQFHRGEHARTSGGAGLGLPIVQASVIAHKGHIWLDSTPRGITMTITLPIRPPVQ